jgi:hypothetical protein
MIRKRASAMCCATIREHAPQEITAAECEAAGIACYGDGRGIARSAEALVSMKSRCKECGGTIRELRQAWKSDKQVRGSRDMRSMAGVRRVRRRKEANLTLPGR